MFKPHKLPKCNYFWTLISFPSLFYKYGLIKLLMIFCYWLRIPSMYSHRHSQLVSRHSQLISRCLWYFSRPLALVLKCFHSNNFEDQWIWKSRKNNRTLRMQWSENRICIPFKRLLWKLEQTLSASWSISQIVLCRPSKPPSSLMMTLRFRKGWLTKALYYIHTLHKEPASSCSLVFKTLNYYGRTH